MHQRFVAMFAGAIVMLIETSRSAHAQPSYGIDFATIGSAGNRASTPQESSQWEYRGGVGAVAYDYKIARTELTVGQYLEFVQAYARFYVGNPNASALTGFWIGTAGSGVYTASPGSENFPADLTWHMAARYCNWLHNAKATNREAFELGAYDTSTFSRNPDFTWNDQTTHSPGAKFWIPTLDEWSKAVYYDPNRYGTGVEGYWTQPNATDTQLISGYPEDGGETSGGLADSDPWLTVPVGSYSQVQSPWGLFDASGGLAECTEEWDDGHSGRIEKGSWQLMRSYFDADAIDGWGIQTPSFTGQNGLRIATIVPASGTSVCWMILVGASVRRKRNA